MLDDICVFSGARGARLANDICELLSIQPAGLKLKRFGDGECDVQLLDNVRGKDVYIINPTCPPGENKEELILLANAARDSSAGRITMVIPYLGDNRKDRKDAPRVPVTAQIHIDQLKVAGAHRALLLDVHSEPTVPHFKPNMTTDHLYASWVAIPYIKKLLGDTDFTVASPDAGGVARVRKYAQYLNRRKLAVFFKFRPAAGEVAEDETIAVGDIADQNILFVDDILDSAKTLVSNGNLAKKMGAKNLYAFITHALLSGEAKKRIADGPFTEIISTDSVGNLEPGSQMIGNTTFTTLTVARLFSRAIQRLHHDKSLSDLILG